MYSFGFTKDLDKGTLEPSHPTTMPTYRIDTKKSILNNSRKRTELIPISGHGLGGTILWKDKALVVGGKEQKFKKISEKSHWSGKHAKKWHWNNSRHPYTVEYDDSTWRAMPKGSSHPCVIFHKKKSHLLRSSEPANIQFLTSLPAEETVFFLLVFIYSEIARAEKLAEGIETASNVIDIATNLAQ